MDNTQNRTQLGESSQQQSTGSQSQQGQNRAKQAGSTTGQYDQAEKSTSSTGQYDQGSTKHM